jgi:hypothetical protein
MSYYEILGISAGLLELTSLPLYIQSILAGKTRPDRVTWWILSLVSGMITASYYASGARETVWLPAAFTLCMAIVAVLSVYYGEGSPHLSFIDRVSVATAALSGVLWWLTQSSVTALFMNMVTEFAGLMPTIIKSYRRPWSESALPWIIGTLAGLLNVLAIREWSFIIAAYPLYIFSTNLIITAFVLRGARA